jgi:glutamate dehydrogenase/leucine dehydrogenase
MNMKPFMAQNTQDLLPEACCMGGSLGRTQATGYGVMFTVREALKR